MNGIAFLEVSLRMKQLLSVGLFLLNVNGVLVNVDVDYEIQYAQFFCPMTGQYFLLCEEDDNYGILNNQMR